MDDRDGGRERESGKSVVAAWPEDDDDVEIYKCKNVNYLKRWILPKEFAIRSIV